MQGLSSAAPSEFLGMAGLAEAALYSLRLYARVIAATGGQADGIHGSVAALEAALRDARYQSDSLMRQLPTWLPLLQQAAQQASAAASGSSSGAAPCEEGFGPTISSLASPGPPSAAIAEQTVLLNSGLSMPLVGLGTCRITMCHHVSPCVTMMDI